ncbi:MAG: InlB B-repeat-containing protein [Firmicutes bacterium]|uniref:InlB B-repeat-containing protein n=1 Tax=Candidatus Scybalomonas excrementavium TaxID=2840943 RepID=A0A9D9HYM6_9FIRM|nr:InlB B-repeat-containing protein [Candidatus Scybalomonas excrementavium]
MEETSNKNLAEEYSISYKLNGGVNSAKNPAIYQKGESITFNAPSKRGYRFAGFYK